MSKNTLSSAQRLVAAFLLSAMKLTATITYTPIQDAQAASADITDFNGDGYEDLAIGAPGEDAGTVVDAGAVHVIYGSASGLSAQEQVGNQFWHQNTPNVEGGSETGDLFSVALA
ncbi:MAG TPA: integrin alpha [Nitrososphaera sp.]|nr:integrin alpha [Nitrososphaera sp.]